VWFGEGAVFSWFLHFRAWQVALTAIVYLGLFATATVTLIRFARRYRTAEEGVALWRLLSLAPMLVVIVGSFASLPILLLIVALGKVI
jgi:hypothetical protein